MISCKKGQIWLVDLGEVVGSEQGGIRPCVIVQNNVGNAYSPTTIICPITTKTKNDLPTHTRTNDLSKPSIILTEQIRVIDKSRLKRFVCTINMENINKALKISLAL